MRLEDEYKRKILSLVESDICSFTKIKESLNIESNQLSYHLNSLVKSGLLSKKRGYCLTPQGKMMMPYLRYSAEYDFLPMVSVGVFIRHRGKVLLLKRYWEPFKGYFLGVSGKLKRHEDVFEAAEKRVKELVDVRVRDLQLFCINNFVSQTNHFVVFFFRAKTSDRPKRGEWVSLKSLPEELFPETEYLLKNLIDSKKPVYINSRFDDRTGRFEVLG